jgi:hypothetical protein
MDRQPVNHDFATSHAIGADSKHWPTFDAAYRVKFGAEIEISARNNDPNLANRLGCDVCVWDKATNKHYFIDEKVRTKDYSDILLEYVSNDRTRAPGWIISGGQNDYVAFLFPAGRVFIYEMAALRSVWRAWGDKFIKRGAARLDGYRLISAANSSGYNTLSVAVPIAKIDGALALATKFEIKAGTR